MTEIRHAAECFSPGTFIREEIEYRGITLATLAQALHGSEASAQELLDGQRRLTAPDAMRLRRLLGPAPEFWMKLQDTWDLWRDWQMTREVGV